MATIKVKLRIVGLYFNETVEVTSSATLSVRDVMDKYIKKNPNLAVVGGLEYERYPIGTSDFVKTISYHYAGNFNYDANDELLLIPAGVDGPTLGNNNNRPAGIYTLSEDLEDELTTKSVGLVWQYYVVSGLDNTIKSKTPPSRGFKSFGADPDYLIEKDDTIIWRLVAIAREPKIPADKI